MQLLVKWAYRDFSRLQLWGLVDFCSLAESSQAPAFKCLWAKKKSLLLNSWKGAKELYFTMLRILIKLTLSLNCVGTCPPWSACLVGDTVKWQQWGWGVATETAGPAGVKRFSIQPLQTELLGPELLQSRFRTTIQKSGLTPITWAALWCRSN